ncbi:MAG: hypothetical protein EOO61_18620 [Hymenobacter sp.]|nr:MAG: hypothetical protein EOO61_18620 [Hymenobacter sp.]
MKPSASHVSTTPAGLPPVPPGFWGVLRIIATRLPAQQLLLLAALLCGFMLLAIGLSAWQLRSLVQPAESLQPYLERVVPTERILAEATRSGLVVLRTTNAHTSRSCCCWQ